MLPAAGVRARHGVAILSLFSTMVYTGGLGALLALGRTQWHPAYGAAAPLWGVTPLEDQQLAGLIVWVPAGVAYLLATPSRGSGGDADLLLGGCERGGALSAADASQLTGGDPARGKRAARQYGCGACHRMRGVPGVDGLVGAPPDGIGTRAYVAGVLTNTPSNLARWSESPGEVDPLTAMPDVGVTAADARDIAAFLYTLR